jgi:hypothetical protein
MLHYATILSGFSYTVQYRSSEKNCNADFCSQFPVFHSKLEGNDDAMSEKLPLDVHKIYHMDAFETLPVTYTRIKEETYKDEALLKIIVDLRARNSTQSNYNLLNDIVVHGDRTVIPQSLQKEIVEELHISHLGMTKMKNLAQNYVYWPGIDGDIENLVKSCALCNQKLSNPAKQWHPWEFSATPWTRLHLDFAEYKKKLYLIIVDSYSKWPEIFETSATSATNTTEILRELFASFGLPQLIVSDNGPPFHSEELVTFLRLNGIRSRFSSRSHPNSNGQAERYVRTFKEAMSADTEGSTRSRVSRFLFSYRRAPNSTTGYSPAEL